MHFKFLKKYLKMEQEIGVISFETEWARSCSKFYMLHQLPSSIYIKLYVLAGASKYVDIMFTCIYQEGLVCLRLLRATRNAYLLKMPSSCLVVEFVSDLRANNLHAVQIETSRFQAMSKQIAYQTETILSTSINSIYVKYSKITVNKLTQSSSSLTFPATSFVYTIHT